MGRHWAAAAVAAAATMAVWACGPGQSPDPVPPTTIEDSGTPGGDGGTGAFDGGTDEGPGVDAGVDAGEPDDDGGTDGGEDGGEDGGTDGGTQTAGPWPTAPSLNYSSEFGIPNVQSVGVDDTYNIWLLDGDRIGVLRPGTSSPVWVSGIGQAAQGFGEDKLARGSTVICGGAANQAYVGYWTNDLIQPYREDPNDPEFKKGDLDVVQLNSDGTISLTEHLYRSAGASQPWPAVNIGIRNTNNWHYDEDRSVLVCRKVMRGRDRGELYIGTNHGVTRIRGLEYSSHRHPVWDVNGSLRIGYNYGLGIAPNGDVLIANEWKVAIVPPPEPLSDWEFHAKAPWALDTHNEQLNTLEEMDYWRGFEQTTDGAYYLASRDFGLWNMERTQWTGSAKWTRVTGVPTEKINAIQATDDGSLFIGTDDSGLWRMGPDKQLTKVSNVSGSRVRQLVYDPTVTPAMLYVLTNSGLTVLRGY